MPPFIWFFDREPTIIQGRSFFEDVSGAINSVAGALPDMGGGGSGRRYTISSQRTTPTVVQRRRINWSWTPLSSSIKRRPDRQNAYLRYKNSVMTPTTPNASTSPATYNNKTYDNVTSPATYNNKTYDNSPATYNNKTYNNDSPATYNNKTYDNSPATNNNKTYNNDSPATNNNSPKTYNNSLAIPVDSPAPLQTPNIRVRGRNTTSERELMKLNKRVDLLRRETEKLLASPTPTSEQHLKRLNKRVDVLRQETDALSSTTRPYRNTTSERELMKLNKRVDLLRRETEKLLRASPTPSVVPRRTLTPSDRFRRAARTATAFRTPTRSSSASPTPSVVPRRTLTPSDRFRRAARTATAFRPRPQTTPAFGSMSRRLQEKRTEYFASSETDLVHLKNLLFQVLFNMPDLSAAQKKDYVRNLKGLIEPHLKELGADVQAFKNFDYVLESKNKRFLDIRKDSVGSISLTKFKVSDRVLKNLSEVMLPL